MKRDDLEKNLELLSLDEFEEDEFMLNTPGSDKKDIFDTALDLFKEDDVVDTTSEQDFLTGIEFEEGNTKKENKQDNLFGEEFLSFEKEYGFTEKVVEDKLDLEPKIEKIDFPMEQLINSKKDDVLEIPKEYKEEVKPIEKVRRNKEEREAYVLSTLKEIKKINDEVIVELKLKRLAAEVRVPYKELRERFEALPKPRKRRVVMDNAIPVMAEENKDEVIETDLKKEDKKTKKKEKKEKKEKTPNDGKNKKLQIVFCVISAIFILGCIIFYGGRMIKYYRIYNPKTENGEKQTLLSSSITANEKIVTEGSGLYKVGSNYEYKGNDVNNYLNFNNQIFRILRINQDGSVDAVYSGTSAELMWNSKYDQFNKSDVYDYLNNEFVKKLDKDKLANINYCGDAVDDLAKISCDKNNTDSLVRLLGITDYLNSKVDGKTFIGDEDIWLYNVSTDKVWHTNGGNLSNSSPNETYGIKPVIRLKNSVALIKGTGTKENPYSLTKENNAKEIGSYVKLGDDLYVVINNTDKLLYLAKKDNVTTTYRFDSTKNVYDPTSKNSVAEYLNNGFYNSLPYKDVIEEATYYNGSYINSYKEITKSNVKAHVGMISMLDSKTNLTDNSFYLINGAEEGFAYYYNNGVMLKSKVTLSRSIKPVIAIKNSILKSGKGTSEDPYVMEG